MLKSLSICLPIDRHFLATPVHKNMGPKKEEISELRQKFTLIESSWGSSLIPCLDAEVQSAVFGFPVFY